MIGQYHRRCAALHGLFRQRNAFPDGMDLCRSQQRLPRAPGQRRNVAGDIGCKFRITVGEHLDGDSDIGHIGKGKAEEHVDIDVGLARFPDQCALGQVPPRRGAGPHPHRRRDDRHVYRDMGRLVVAADRAHQHARGALALQVFVVMREIFDGKAHVGVLEELVVLIAVQIEGRGDNGLRSHHLARPARQLRLRPQHAAHRHRAVDAEIDAVERAGGLQSLDHLAGERLEGLFGHPARTHIGLRPQRRFNADELDAVELARHLHKAAHVGFWVGLQQRLALRGRTRIDEIIERGVVLEEGDGLVGKMQHRDSDRIAYAFLRFTATRTARRPAPGHRTCRPAYHRRANKRRRPAFRLRRIRCRSCRRRP